MISSRYGSFLKKTQKQNAWFSLRWRLAISLHIFNVLGCNQIYLMSVVVLADNTIGRNVTCRSFFPPTSFRKPLSPASNPLHTRKFAQLRIVFKVCPSSKFIAEQMRVPTHGEISKKSFFFINSRVKQVRSTTSKQKTHPGFCHPSSKATRSCRQSTWFRMVFFRKKTTPASFPLGKRFTTPRIPHKQIFSFVPRFQPRNL